MLKTYKALKDEGMDNYRISKAVREGTLYKVEPGIYSDSPTWHEVEVVLAKYPKAVLTLDSAYHYYDLTDMIPGVYNLATDRDGAKIHDKRVAQCFVPLGSLEFGKVERELHGIKLRIFDRERLLIETIRLKSKIPYDLYREVIGNYRRIREELYGSLIDDYLAAMPRRDAIFAAIQSEVF